MALQLISARHRFQWLSTFEKEWWETAKIQIAFEYYGYLCNPLV